MKSRIGLMVVMMAGIAALVGCHSKPAGDAAASASATKQYPVRGTVMAMDAKDNSISLANEDIPGFMGPMTMDYAVTDPAAMTEMHVGDKIAATLLVDEANGGAENPRLQEIVIVGEANVNIKPTVQYHMPAQGDVVPDFKLLNQSGRMIDLKQYRGKVVALTFIYTRCPLADYCPRMSRNFAVMEKALEAQPAVYAKTHLLSVSFDPKYDTPKVLKSYGEAYTGKYTEATFGHWEFAAPPEDELAKVEQWFSVGVTPGENGTLQHSLSTVVIGKDGKVVAFWPTNDWTPAEVLAKIEAAAAA